MSSRTGLFHALNRSLSRWMSRVLSGHCILVLGCQRSGTTLLFMMLTSHPRIGGRNEDEVHYRLPSPLEILRNLLSGKRTCYKAITHVGRLKKMRSRFPKAKLVWIVRHPCAVVSSMRALEIQPGRSWAELESAHELRELAPLFPEIDQIRMTPGPVARPVLRGAYIWKYKAMAIGSYEKEGFQQTVIRYEDLLQEPEATLRSVLSELGLDWNPQVLQHERHHEGKRYLGNNSGDRPLDSSRLLDQGDLSPEEADLVRSICSLEMSRWRYS